MEDTGRVEFKRGTVDGSASKIVRTADTRGVRRIETGANFIRRALLESPHWGPANHMLENSAVVPDNPDQT